jgi:deoxyxylulose-5-phosphate synthase
MDIKSEEIFVTEDGIRRQLEGKELENFLTQRQIDNSAKLLKLQAEQERQTARQEVLAKLGLTEQEAKTLLG